MTYTHCVCVCVCGVSLVAQSSPTLCKSMDYSPLGSSVHEISQERILEWVATSYGRRSSQLRDRTHVSCIFCIGSWILYHYRHVRSPPALTALKKTFILICFGLISDPRSPFQEFTPALNRFSRSSSGPNTEGLYEYPCNCSMTSIFKAGILFFS